MTYDSEFKSHLSYPETEKAFREAKKFFCDHKITVDGAIHHKDHVECRCSKCGKKYKMSEKEYNLATGMVSISDSGVFKRDIFLTMKDEHYRKKMMEYIEA